MTEPKGAGSSGRGSLPPKLYFRIGEVAGLVGVEPHVLRYWEREFRSIRPTKSAKGQRVYSRRDVENLLRVRDLLYAEGFTIAGAKKRLLRAGVEKGADKTADKSADKDGKKLEVAPQTVVHAEVQAQAHVAVARAPRVESKHPPRVREKLMALRAEVEAFLQELGG